MYRIIRSDEEIDAVLDSVIEVAESGNSGFFGMSYEEGIDYAIKWLTDEGAPHPLED